MVRPSNDGSSKNNNTIYSQMGNRSRLLKFFCICTNRLISSNFLLHALFSHLIVGLPISVALLLSTSNAALSTTLSSAIYLRE